MSDVRKNILTQKARKVPKTRKKDFDRITGLFWIGEFFELRDSQLFCKKPAVKPLYFSAKQACSKVYRFIRG